MINLVSPLHMPWWVLFGRGIAAVLFGMLLLWWPLLSLVVLLAFFAGYALLDGSLAAVGAALPRSDKRAWWRVLAAAAPGVLAGLFILAAPALASTALLWLIAARALLLGGLALGNPPHSRPQTADMWLLRLHGILFLIVGIAALAWPGGTALALAWLIGSHALLDGALLLALALRRRALPQVS